LKSLSPQNLLRKAHHARAQACRHDSALPKALPGGQVTTIGGKLCVVLMLADGSITGYATVPTFRLEQLTRGQLAPFRANEVTAATSHERLRQLVGMVLNELARVEVDANQIVQRANGNGHADIYRAAADNQL
jgi:hypothetical protein